MVPDRQKVWTDGWTDGQRQNYITPTLSGDKTSVFRVTGLKILGRVGTHIFFNSFFFLEFFFFYPF